MMSVRLPICLSAIIFLVIVSSALAEPPTEPLNTTPDRILLQYQFHEGEQWHYQMRQKGRQTARSVAGNQTFQNDSTQWKHYRVMETFEDGSAWLEVVFDRYRIHFKMSDGEQPAQAIKYDTKQDDQAPEVLRGLEKSVGPFARVKMAPSGKVLELELLQNVEQNHIPMQPDDKRIAKPVQGLPIELPSDPIAVGERWTNSRTVKLPVSHQLRFKKEKVYSEFEILTSYELKTVEEDVAKIDYRTYVKPRITNPLLKGRMMQYLPRGTVRFDLTHGRILSRTEQVDELEVGVAGPKTSMQVQSQKIEKLIPSEKEIGRLAN